MFQRFSLFIFSAAVVSGILLVSFYATESDILQRIRFPSRQQGLTNEYNAAPSTSEEVILSTSRHIDAHKVNHDPNRPVEPATTVLGLPLKVNDSTTRPPRAVLVISTVTDDDTSWINGELGELLQPGGDFSTQLYVNNNLTAPLHPPANKGHEATAYLTYIIDNYHELPPISIFLHGHAEAWHNNILLDMSTSEMLRSLRLDKVEQEGYFNLRCHWNPGCPEHLYPFATEDNAAKPEELLVKDAFMQVFGVDEDRVPRVLGQACCSQFAVTANRIHSLPREKYIHFRNWLLETKLSDFFSGRFFEYFWQYMLNGTPVFCPDPRICYCEGYGICFEDPADYDGWFTMIHRLWQLKDQLEAWKHWWQDDDDTVEKRLAGLKEVVETSLVKKQKAPVGDLIYRPPQRRGAWLQREIDELAMELGRRRQQAQSRGQDPVGRVAAVKAAKALAPPETEDLQHGGWQKKRDVDV